MLRYVANLNLVLKLGLLVEYLSVRSPEWCACPHSEQLRHSGVQTQVEVHTQLP